ncbi:hypothetical protein DFH08DRAFT_708132 [Mycena albidolilacea]|uniref:DDE-1 domain-containing protein n=1 Tax=Mycena albidolilacea TaxID=1033008 RepID=A0AAD6ZPL3_9AGAR|nr:hypothetical protein DFH08DRAFT_708132 [Mycena albidolilacea]
MYPVPRVNDTGFHAPVYGYLSDVESSESDSDSGDEGGDESETRAQPVRNKRRKLDVPVREQVRLKKEKRAKDRHDALTAVEKVISLKRTEYQGPLQAKRTQVIQSTLHLVVRNSRSLMEASAMAAETHGFAAIWGSRLTRKWTAEWVKRRELPESERGRHAKTWSLLQDPEIKEELVAYLRSNKWSMDPAKLVQYSESQMVTAEMRKYVQTAVNKEMPRGLKKYLEVELFPRIGYKVSRGISLATARQFQLILTPHDEMTAQANDADKSKWVLKGEMPIRKKGVGRGIHRSDIICSTVGHIDDAGEGMEYGKNYEGYWDGARFIKQLEVRIIPAFERRHDRNIYRALFLIDNSQGHCAYSEDALVVNRMNWRSGGKQALMRDGWFMHAGQRIPQKMVLPDGQPKGMKIFFWGAIKKYLRKHCDYTFEGLRQRMDDALRSVDIMTIRKWERRTYRWLDAYRQGLDCKDAQVEVKKFSTRQYKSHRRVGERMGRAMDMAHGPSGSSGAARD